MSQETNCVTNVVLMDSSGAEVQMKEGCDPKDLILYGLPVSLKECINIKVSDRAK